MGLFDMELRELKTLITKKVNEKEYIKTEIQKLKETKLNFKKSIIRKEKALELVKDVALKTQQQLSFHLSEMVTMGLNTVFEDSYEFVVDFKASHGKTVCDLNFKKGEELVDPLRFSGLGAADIAAFALRCAAWSMDKQYRNVLLMDEPFKHLDVGHHGKAGKMVKTLSEKLGLQIIMISHSEKVTQYADRVFQVSMKKGISKVRELKELKGE